MFNQKIILDKLHSELQQIVVNNNNTINTSTITSINTKNTININIHNSTAKKSKMIRQKSCDNVAIKPIIRQPQQIISPRYQAQITIKSNGLYAIYNHTQIPNDILNLKPHKKFSLNCKISCILSITSQLFLFTSINESTFKLFDIIHNIVVNETIAPSPILSLQKISTPYNNSDTTFISLSNDGILRVWAINLQSKKLKVIKEISSKAQIVAALDLNNNSDFVLIDDQGYIGYVNIYLNDEEYPTQSRYLGKKPKLELYEKGLSFITYSTNMQGKIWSIVKINQNIEIQLMFVTSIALSPSLFSLDSIDHAIFLASNEGLKIFYVKQNLKQDENLGDEVQIIKMSQKISKRFDGYYDIRQQQLCNSSSTQNLVAHLLLQNMPKQVRVNTNNSQDDKIRAILRSELDVIIIKNDKFNLDVDHLSNCLNIKINFMFYLQINSLKKYQFI